MCCGQGDERTKILLKRSTKTSKLLAVSNWIAVRLKEERIHGAAGLRGVEARAEELIRPPRFLEPFRALAGARGIPIYACVF